MMASILNAVATFLGYLVLTGAVTVLGMLLFVLVYEAVSIVPVLWAEYQKQREQLAITEMEQHLRDEASRIQTDFQTSVDSLQQMSDRFRES